jgi:hypothetical protein
MNGSTLLAHDLARGVRPIARVDEVGSPAALGGSLPRARSSTCNGSPEMFLLRP